MIYEIKNKYYILVGNKYIYVDIIPNGKDDINLEPDTNNYIERSANVIARAITIDKNFIDNYMKNSKFTFDLNNNSRRDR